MLARIIVIPGLLCTLPVRAESTGAAPVSLRQYTAWAQKNSLSVKNAKSQRIIAGHQEKITNERSLTNLSLTPWVRTADRYNLTETLNDEPNPSEGGDRPLIYGVNLNLTQTLPSGTLLGFRADQTRQTEDTTGSFTPASSMALYLSQPLARNGFGRAGDLLVGSAGQRHRAATLQEEDARLAECTNAATLFGRVYALQKRMAIMKDIAATSSRIYRTQSRYFRSRLVPRLQYLLAETDYTDTRTRVLALQGELDLALVELSENAGRKIRTLASPEEDLRPDLRPLSRADIDRLPAVRAAKADQMAARFDVKQSREQSRARVDLNVEAGRTENEARYTFGDRLLSTYTRENYVQLGVTMDLPLINDRPDYQVYQAVETWRMASDRVAGARRTVAIHLQQQEQSLTHLQEAVALREKNLALTSRQLQEARRLLSDSRIDLETYLFFRNRYREQHLTFWQVRLELWRAGLQLARIRNHRPAFCR